MDSLLKTTSAYKQMQADAKNGALHHAYLLILDDARNLRTALKTFAKLVFLGDERVSKLIDSESFSDCLFFPEADKKFVVEDAERVSEEATLQPVEGNKKVFVIGDFAQVNATSQNKLLKLLEEPPKSACFLLGATTQFPVLPTVLSRVKKLEIPPFDTGEIVSCLERIYKSRFDKNDYALCAAASGGCIGQAQNMLEGGTYKAMIDDAFSLVLVSPSALPALIKRVGESKRKKELLALLRMIFRDALLIKTGLKEENTFLRAESARLLRVAEKCTSAMLVRAQDEIGKAEREVAFNAVFPQCLEVLLGRINK